MGGPAARPAEAPGPHAQAAAKREGLASQGVCVSVSVGRVCLCACVWGGVCVHVYACCVTKTDMHHTQRRDTLVSVRVYSLLGLHICVENF